MTPTASSSMPTAAKGHPLVKHLAEFDKLMKHGRRPGLHSLRGRSAQRAGGRSDGGMDRRLFRALLVGESALDGRTTSNLPSIRSRAASIRSRSTTSGTTTCGFCRNGDVTPHPHRPSPDEHRRPTGRHAQRQPGRPRGDRQRRAAAMAWARERPDGGRGFGFTGGHVHWNWGNDNFRKLVLNAIVWAAHVDVPPDGVPSRPLTLEELEANQDKTSKARPISTRPASRRCWTSGVRRAAREGDGRIGLASLGRQPQGALTLPMLACGRPRCIRPAYAGGSPARCRRCVARWHSAKCRPLPQDEHPPSQAVAGLDVGPGLEATLFASEPMMLSPTNIDVDARGRVWVCEVVNYRHRNGDTARGRSHPDPGRHRRRRQSRQVDRLLPGTRHRLGHGHLRARQPGDRLRLAEHLRLHRHRRRRQGRQERSPVHQDGHAAARPLGPQVRLRPRRPAVLELRQRQGTRSTIATATS